MIVEQMFFSPQVKRSVASRVAERLKALPNLGKQKIPRKFQNFIESCPVLSPPHEMEIFSVLVSISWKIEIELLPQCAI